MGSKSNAIPNDMNNERKYKTTASLIVKGREGISKINIIIIDKIPAKTSAISGVLFNIFLFLINTKYIIVI
ncbi:MAG: hypothetical protein SVZ03_12395 [Spirochaetota bacterium]|nr:hypothetical protein [Spirochaetota bacterium]